MVEAGTDDLSDVDQVEIDESQIIQKKEASIMDKMKAKFQEMMAWLTTILSKLNLLHTHICKRTL